MKDKSHVTEIVQQTRMELENGNISPEEIESSITVRGSRVLCVCGYARLKILSSFPFHCNTAVGLSLLSRSHGTRTRFARLVALGEMGVDAK